MAPMSRGSHKKVSRSVALKRGKLASVKDTKNHRFETFSQRIAKTKIDPIRRSKKTVAPDSAVGSSHFRASLEEWRDTNMSATFTEFAQKVDPLCQSLPQIIHYQEQIVDLLLQHIEKHDSLSLEPLLDLVAQIAHDLGERFESFFGKTVKILMDLAAKHEDVAVIEWSFNCLAWLFKFLSRLLVPDLRPLLDLIAPLLGKAHQKDFISQFAADVMSFLVRKAGVLYAHDSKPLVILVRHVLEDLNSMGDPNKSQYGQGLAAMFAESIKAIQRGVSPGATAVLKVLLQTVEDTVVHDQHEDLASKKLLQEVLINVIHHSDSEGFEPLQDIILEHVRTLDRGTSPSTIAYRAQVLFDTMGARRGTRITNWDGFLDAIQNLIKSVQPLDGPRKSGDVAAIMNALAVAIQCAPVDVLHRHWRILKSSLTTGHFEEDFLRFCDFMFEMGHERFFHFLLQDFQRLINDVWTKHDLQAITLLSKFAASAKNHSMQLYIPETLQQNISHSIHTMTLRENVSANHDIPSYDIARLYLTLLTRATCNPYTKQSVIASVSKLVNSLGQSEDDVHMHLKKFAFTGGLWFLSSQMNAEELSKLNWSDILHAASTFGRNPLYLEATTKGLKTHTAATSDLTDLIEAVKPNLTSPEHQLRLDTLYLLETLSDDKPELPLVKSALSIETSPLNIETIRALSIDVRKLAALYLSTKTPSTSPLKGAIYLYFFGLMHLKLAPVWEDVCNGLRDMSSASHTEQQLFKDTIKQWLNENDASVPKDIAKNDDVSSRPLNPDFECSNLNDLRQKARKSHQDSISLKSPGDGELAVAHGQASDLSRSSPLDRSKALFILNKLPHLAEKNSRVLSPLLLDWFGNINHRIDKDDSPEDFANRIQSQANERQRMPRKDKTELLKVFSQFVNPGVLFCTQEVYQTLLDILCNGETETQRLALKAIFTWKQNSVKPYEQSLLNLLDDAKFRDELSTFSSSEEGDSQIQLEHKIALMPILLRILYGRSLGKSVSKGAGGQEAKRKAILMSLTRFKDEDLGAFIDIALGPLRRLTENPGFDLEMILSFHMPLSRQHGMLRLLNDMLESLSNRIGSFGEKLCRAILYCLIRSSRELDKTEKLDGDNIPEQSSLSRIVRREGMSCLVALFATDPEHDWSSYFPIIMKELVNPRIQSLPIETAQGVSSLLRLFSTWSLSSKTIGLITYENTRVFKCIAACLAVASAREEVKIFVLNIINNVLEVGIRGTSVVDNERNNVDAKVNTFICAEGCSILLAPVSKLFERISSNKEIMQAAVKVLSHLASLSMHPGAAPKFIGICLLLLRQPSRTVSPLMKGNVLDILQKTFATTVIDVEDFSKSIETLAPLFSFFTDAPNRKKLSEVFELAAKHDSSMLPCTKMCRQLNAFMPNRLQEPDFDVRLNAFEELNNKLSESLSPSQWLPIIHNLLFHVRDKNETSIRSSASSSLRHFVVLAASDTEKASSLRPLLDKTVSTALSHGMREPSELVRAEYVAILSDLVRYDCCSTGDMKSLLGSDEESSFFNNILHIQKHRRSRALRRLVTEAPNISSENISRYCLPLLEHTLSEDNESSTELREESVKTFGILLRGLEWSKYRQRLQHIVQDKARFASKAGIRIVSNTIDAIYHAHMQKAVLRRETDASSNRATERIEQSNLAVTLPEPEALCKKLSDTVLSPLITYVHFKDENTVEHRVNVSIAIVKLILMFPQDQIEMRLPAVLMDVCNVLKSRAQEARDAARNTLATISALIGPTYFGFLLKQLRSALQRGYQLHVLSYTLHSILLQMSPNLQPGDLDYCLGDIMAIVREDIFGTVGQEKEAQEYRSKMREVKKKQLGYDTLEIIARITSLGHIRKLVEPIQSQLEDTRPRLEKIEELLRRLREGLRQNEQMSEREALQLCYELLQNARGRAVSSKHSIPKRQSKMIAFSLDLLRRTLDKHENLKTTDNLQGFIQIIDESIRSSEDEVRIAAMRVMTAIIKVPLKTIDEEAGQYLSQVRQIIEAEPTTTTPLCQTGLRLVAALLRERPNAVIKQAQFSNHVAFILSRIRPDLHEPARQGNRDRQIAAFNFLRAVLGRGILMPEIYQIMDTVREIMVTSSENPIPDLARSVYSRFILDYFPDAGKGLTKQFDYLVSNLQYPHSRGRQSVMEVLSFVMGKKNDQNIQPILVEFFLPLVLILATDESTESSAMAKSLLRKFFERADKERMNMFKNQLMKWLDQDSDLLWQRVSLVCLPVYLDANEKARREAMTAALATRRIIETSLDAEEPGKILLAQSALDLLVFLSKVFSGFAFSSEMSSTWKTMFELAKSINYTFASKSLQLIGLFAADLVQETTKNGRSLSLPLLGSEGLQFDSSDAGKILDTHLAILKRNTDDHCIDMAIANLGFIGRVTCNDSNTVTFNELINEVCGVIRLESRDNGIKRRQSALKLLMALCKLASNDHLEDSLELILHTLNNLTDSEIPTTTLANPNDTELQDELKATAQELQTMLQTKFGTSDFVGHMQKVRQQVKQRREQRRAKRHIEAVSTPEKAERAKMRKHEKTKMQRKAKNKIAAGFRRGW